MNRSRARLGLAGLLLLALVSAAGAQHGARRQMPTRLVVPAPITLDFETEDDLVTPLINGQSLSSPEELGRLLSISNTGLNAGAAIFDSTPGGPNDPSQDPDLLVGLGNVLILQNSAAPGQTTADVFDRPNDDQDGGELVFDFETPVQPVDVVLIDIDAGAQQGSSVTLLDENGRTRVYSVPPRWTRDLMQDGAPGWGRLAMESLDPQPGFLATATGVEDPGFDAVHVVRLVVRLGSSGAVDLLRWRPGRSLGLIGDDTGHSVYVFDADQDEIVTRVFLPVPPGAFVGDCAIDPRTSLGYASDFLRHVWVIDLAQSPPQLAAGINPIQVSNPAEDVSLSPDGRFLAVADGSAFAPLSIVDLSTRTEVGSVSTGNDCNSVDFCTNDALVGTSFNLARVVGFALDGSGTPSLTGDDFFLDTPNNAASAPGGRIGVGISRVPRRLVSFQVDGLLQEQERILPAVGSDGLSVCFSPDGTRVFARQTFRVSAWSLDPLTGDLGAVPLYQFTAGEISTFFGMDRIAVHPDGSRLYVLEPGALRIHDPANGALLRSIPLTLGPGGIAVERGLR